MTDKKIEFSKKPTLKQTNQFIDNWVSGKNESQDLNKKQKRTTIYLPEDLHKKLRIKAADNGKTMTIIITDAIESYLR